MFIILHAITKDGDFSETRKNHKDFSACEDRTSKLCDTLNSDAINIAITNALITSPQELGAVVHLKDGSSIEVIESKSYIEQLVQLMQEL